MANKNNIVSIILFVISGVLFVVFSLTIFFGGQKIGGSIYFIYFAIMVAFAFLDRKYASNFINFYRFSTYLSDAFNILAVGSIIYYHQHIAQMIASVSILGLCLLVDLFSKNRLETRRLSSILITMFNLTLMFTIFPFFFISEYTLSLAICVVILSCLLLCLKLILAFLPGSNGQAQKKNEKSESDLVSEVSAPIEQDLE